MVDKTIDGKAVPTATRSYEYGAPHLFFDLLTSCRLMIIASEKLVLLMLLLLLHVCEICPSEEVCGQYGRVRSFGRAGRAD